MVRLAFFTRRFTENNLYKKQKTNLSEFPTGSLFNKPRQTASSAVHILAASARSALVVAHAI